MSESWIWKSLSPEEVSKRLISVHERIDVALYALDGEPEDHLPGAIKILKDAADLMGEVYGDIERVREEAATDE